MFEELKAGLMASGDGPGLDPLGRSGSCTGGMHEECGHVGLGARRCLPPGRLQSMIVLCRCSCHAECPVTGWRHVPLTAWQELCACSGDKRQRAWKEDVDGPWPGAQEQRERQDTADRDRRQARQQAFEAARGAAAGKTRDQVRQIYLDELRARRQDTPSEPLLEAHIDMLVGRPIRALAKLWRAFTRPDRSSEQ